MPAYDYESIQYIQKIEKIKALVMHRPYFYYSRPESLLWRSIKRQFCNPCRSHPSAQLNIYLCARLAYG